METTGLDYTARDGRKVHRSSWRITENALRKKPDMFRRTRCEKSC